MADLKVTERPPEPDTEGDIWYRGWEAGFDDMAHHYTSEGWRAYKGGCDLDAPQLSSKTWAGLLDAIDEAEGN